MYLPGSQSSGLFARSSSGIASIARSPALVPAFFGLKSYASGMHQLQRRSISDSLDAVDLAICLCSVVGALFIIIPYCINKEQRKLRHSLILGLATSDLISSVIIIATSSVGLAGERLHDTPRFCTFAGYSFVVAIWTQHLWNLSIAIITYMILVHPLSIFVSRVEKHIIWLWPAFWALSLLVNGIGWIVAGFGDIGGYCGFRANGGGKLFAPIFYFVPRCLVVLTVLVLYTHLFFFLRRVNMFNKMNLSSRQRTSPSGESRNRGELSTMNHQGGGVGGISQQSDGLASLQGDHLANSGQGSWDRRYSSAGSSKFGVWKKWKKGSLSTSPSGIGSTRGNSQSTQGKSASTASPVDENLAIHTVEMVNYTDLSPKTKPTEIAPDDSTTTTNTPEEKAAQSMSDRSEKPVTVSVPIIRPPPIQRHASGSRSTDLLSPTSSQQQRSSITSARRNPSSADDEEVGRGGEEEEEEEVEEEEEEEEDDDDDDEEDDPRRKRGSDMIGWKEAFQPMAPRRDLRDFGMTSAPREHLKHYALSPAGVDMLKRQKDGSAVEGNATTNDTTYVNDGYESALGNNWTWGMQVGGGGGGDGNKENASKSPPTPTSPTTPSGKRMMGQASNHPDRIGQKSTSSSLDENGVEALGSTLNRQASILLLLYPGVYCLLFSISIIRIIVDLTGPNLTIAQKMAKNKDALHSISRWTIFAQGAIDAIVFQLVERAFRARMKRQRRIAAGEAVDQPCFIHMWQKLSSLWQRSSSKSTSKKTSTSQ